MDCPALSFALTVTALVLCVVLLLMHRDAGRDRRALWAAVRVLEAAARLPALKAEHDSQRIADERHREDCRCRVDGPGAPTGQDANAAR